MAADNDISATPALQENVLPDAAAGEGPPIQAEGGQNERARIAIEEGCHPYAVAMIFPGRPAGAKENIRILVLALLAAGLVFGLFPFERFFKPRPEALGPLVISRSLGDRSPLDEQNRQAPWYDALQTVERLYFSQGRLTEAIQAAETALAAVPVAERREWAILYYRYWQLLTDAGRFDVLSASTDQYLAASAEDPYATYFRAHGFSLAAAQTRTQNVESASALRRQAESIHQQLLRTLNALNARLRGADDSSEGEDAGNMIPKLRLEEARLLALIWQLGGFREDNHPDVRYRDQALEILEDSPLARTREAMVLKRDIYRDILLRWHWYEGSEPVNRKVVTRQAIRAELQELETMIAKAAEK